MLHACRFYEYGTWNVHARIGGEKFNAAAGVQEVAFIAQAEECSPQGRIVPVPEQTDSSFFRDVDQVNGGNPVAVCCSMEAFQLFTVALD